jgi:hypothetical protein
MSAGRPKKVDPGTLYTFAHVFYWDFRRIAEGGTRRRFDETTYRAFAEAIDKVELQLTAEERTNIERVAEREIRSGRLQAADKSNFIRSAEDSQLRVNRDWFHDRAAEKATKELRIPAEPEVITELLQAETAEQIRTICDDAFSRANREVAPGVIREVRIRNWPIPIGSTLPSYLSQYASEFIAARKDPRFPRSTIRPTSCLKQLWFLSRALAGALYGVSTRTAINLVGSKRPEQVFQESRAAKPVRKKSKIVKVHVAHRRLGNQKS